VHERRGWGVLGVRRLGDVGRHGLVGHAATLGTDTDTAPPVFGHRRGAPAHDRQGIGALSVTDPLTIADRGALSDPARRMAG
jgi:hypothetical protein